MPARSVAQIVIRFGPVAMPVKLYTTTPKVSDDGPRFVQLHDADGGRLQQRSVCLKCDQQVSQEHTVRGYEHAKDSYTVFSADDLKQLDALADGSFGIREFVHAGAIDPLYIEKSFYVGPDRGGEMGFRLLWDLLGERGLVAVGSYAAHRRQTIAALRPLGDLLVMHQVRYAHELAPANDVPPPEVVEPPAAALDIAHGIAARMTRDRFEAAAYRDDVRPRVMALVNAKVEGKELEEVQSPDATEDRLADMLETLRRSLGPGAVR